MGKSTLNFQLAMNYVALSKRRAILVDTEGSMDAYRGYHKTFQERFETDAPLVHAKYVQKPTGEWVFDRSLKAKEIPEPAIVILECRSVFGILDMHGRPIKVESPKGKKLQITRSQDRWQYNVYETPLGKLIVELGAGYISYDSISAPMKDAFGNETHNLPARAEATAYWMGPAQNILANLNIGGIATMHYSKDPTDQYGKVFFSGGLNLGHTFKYVFQMGPAKENIQRKLTIQRHPTKGRNSEGWLLQFTPTGLVDVGPANMTFKKDKKEEDNE